MGILMSQGRQEVLSNTIIQIIQFTAQIFWAVETPVPAVDPYLSQNTIVFSSFVMAVSTFLISSRYQGGTKHRFSGSNMLFRALDIALFNLIGCLPVFFSTSSFFANFFRNASRNNSQPSKSSTNILFAISPWIPLPPARVLWRLPTLRQYTSTFAPCTASFGFTAGCSFLYAVLESYWICRLPQGWSSWPASPRGQCRGHCPSSWSYASVEPTGSPQDPGFRGRPPCPSGIKSDSLQSPA